MCSEKPVSLLCSDGASEVEVVVFERKRVDVDRVSKSDVYFVQHKDGRI